MWLAVRFYKADIIIAGVRDSPGK